MNILDLRAAVMVSFPKCHVRVCISHDGTVTVRIMRRPENGYGFVSAFTFEELETLVPVQCVQKIAKEYPELLE